MKPIPLVLLSLLISTIAVSQAVNERTVINDPNAEPRAVKDFDAIHVSNGIALMIKQGDAEGIAVSASREQFRDKIRTVVENGVLKIYYDNGKIWKTDDGNKKLRAYVSVKTLEKLSGSSGAVITVNGIVSARHLAINLSSGSHIKGEVKADELSIDQSSGAVAKLKGSARSVTVETSSGSGFYGFELLADLCHARATSGSHIEITVNKELEGRANSGGGIRYQGSGVEKHASVSSGGSINRKG